MDELYPRLSRLNFWVHCCSELMELTVCGVFQLHMIRLIISWQAVRGVKPHIPYVYLI